MALLQETRRKPGRASQRKVSGVVGHALTRRRRTLPPPPPPPPRPAGRIAEAEKLYFRALGREHELRGRTKPPENHPATLGAMAGVANLLAEQGARGAALSLARSLSVTAGHRRGTAGRL